MLTVPFWYDSKVNAAGAILNVDPKAFNSRFMVKVEEPKPIETPIAEVITTTPILLDVGGPPKQEMAKPVLKEKVLEQHDY